MKSTPVMIRVRKPPAWKAALGMNDMPTMTQKIARDAKRHARKTVSNAIRRMSSTTAILVASSTPRRLCSLLPLARQSQSRARPHHKPILRKLPMAGIVKMPVPASQIHNEPSVESPRAPM